MDPGCAVGSQWVLTADGRYFQKPPAEQFISLSSTCTALLNNAQWRKTPEARCSDAQLCIHEALIAAAATLFIQPLHMFMFYTPCRKSRYLYQQQLLLWVLLLLHPDTVLCLIFTWLAVWFFKLSFESFSLSFDPFTSFAQRRFMSLFVRMKQHICALSNFAEQAQGDSLQSAVSFLILVLQHQAGKTLW